MAKPAYIVCASSKSEDRETNSLSLFDLVERVILDVPSPSDLQSSPLATSGPVAAASASFRASVVSVWIKDAIDFGAEYDSQLCLVSPSGVENSRPLASFTMKPEPTSFLHRVVVNLHGLPALNESGVWMIEIRIRPSGGRWIKQGYPLIVDASEAYLAAVASADSGLSIPPTN